LSDFLPSLDNERQSSALLRLLNQAGARRVLSATPTDFGLAEQLSYPFLAIVGQFEMRIALMLAVINPAIGGVLLIGPRGTGKTTAVRSLVDILPEIEVSDCEEGVLPEDLERENADLLFPECFEQHQKGQPISHFERVRLVELPLNATLDDVVGGVNQRVAMQQKKVRLERGILGRADRNLLYVDEVNLLDDSIVDAILDAAAMGNYTVRRGAMAGTYRSRFVMIGSMNPEEGRLRPQILDRFGLRVNVRGLSSNQERLTVYQRVRDYRKTPVAFIRRWETATEEARREIIQAQELMKDTVIPDQVLEAGLSLVNDLQIDSHRAEYTLFETTRAYAASDGRTEATIDDLKIIAPLALRQRRSEFMVNYFEQSSKEDEQIRERINSRS